MTKQHFRLMSIELDPDEEVAAVRAMATAEAAALISERFLTGERIESGETGQDGRRLISLLAQQAVRLHDGTGKIRGDDPIAPVSSEIYDSLCIVVNGLMEDW